MKTKELIESEKSSDEIVGTLTESPDETARILIDGEDWYLRRIDSTHVAMANNPAGAQRASGAAVWHVAQLRDKSYYMDIRDWLHGKLDIEGNSYRRS